MRRRGGASVAANPVLIGAATVLVVVVAVFLAYNANNGLPFVPTYQLTAQAPDAANLVVGNDVRIGGARVGVVDQITTKSHKSGRVTALLRLKLQTTIKPLYTGTHVLVRSRSALGLKYVELTPGKRTGKAYADGATLPLKAATPAPVEIDQVFNTFNKKTREATSKNLSTFGQILAGRGTDLNLAIQALNPLLKNVIPVSKNLADPRTRLAGFVEALARAASETASVAETQAALFRNLDTTFSALSDVREAIKATISTGPATLTAVARSLRIQRPFLDNSAALFADLRPGARALGRSAPTISSALALGTKVLPRTVPLNRSLAKTLVTLGSFAQDPGVSLGLKGLRQTALVLRPTIDFLAPAQLNCNYLGLWFRNVPDLLSDGDRKGTWQRFIIILTPGGPNNEGGPSSAPANGPDAPNYLHTNYYPNVGAPGQTKECEAGNETAPGAPLSTRPQIGNVAGNQGLAHDVTKIDKTN